MRKKFIIFKVTLCIFLFITLIIFLDIKKFLIKTSFHPNTREFSIASGVVPHHLVAKDLIEKFFQYIASKEIPQTIVFLGGDHFKATVITGKSFLSTNNLSGFQIDNNLLQKLSNFDNLGFSNFAISSDHGIRNLLPYVNKYFPESRILPIIISPKASREEVEELIRAINHYSDLRTIVIASVDFSHYLPPEVADFHDVKSISTLLEFKKEDFANLDVDSWQALYGARFFARLKNKEQPYIIGRGKSSDFLGLANNFEEGVTSYFSVIFGEEKSREIFKEGITILLVGDIMLDRHVKDLMKKNGLTYPFQKINRLLKGVDIVFGNLEGPIVKEPQKFPHNSLRFNFSPEVVEALSWSNFNLLSLANNHTLDRGREGLEETKKFLEKKNIKFVGDPVKCTEASSFKKGDVIFLAFNKTYPTCPDKEIIETINLVKQTNPYSFLIISIHWGIEYEERNSIYQKNLAYKMIDAGADTIIGHHPHVVQNIEIYKNKLIFYSLGNFIFDQYFSKETQEGLVVGMEVYPEKVVYRLFPVKSNLSQPSLMNQEEKERFLQKLARNSSPQLFEKIKSGIIEIKR